MITVEVQYFEGCPHSDEMIERVKRAIAGSDVDIEYREVLVDTPKLAQQYRFRGSPTLIINGRDLEGLPEPANGNLSCRYYKDGLPTVNEIRHQFELQNKEK